MSTTWWNVRITKIKECNNYTCWLVNMLCKHSFVIRCMANYNIQNNFVMNISWSCPRVGPYLSHTYPVPVPYFMLIAWLCQELVMELSQSWPVPVPYLSCTCSILHADWLVPHHTIPNTKFPPMTLLLSRPDCHKSAKCSPPPCPGPSILITKLTLLSQQQEVTNELKL